MPQKWQNHFLKMSIDVFVIHTDFQQLNQLQRLPAAIGHADKGYHVLTHENVVPTRNQVVTTVRTDRPLRKSNQGVTKVKIKVRKHSDVTLK